MNIFQISQDLLDAFQELEDNGGELTEELEAKLSVSQADFKTKLDSYTKVIKNAESDINACDLEIKRLQTVKKSKQAAIDRLNKVIAWAVEMFGDTTKSGGKFVDLGTSKIQVRLTDKVEVNENFASETVDKFMDEIRHFAFTKELYYDELEDIVDIPKDKLEGVTANISFDIPLKAIYSENGYNVIKSLYLYNQNFKAKANISKTELKGNLKENPDAYPNLAHLTTNKTVTIK